MKKNIFISVALIVLAVLAGCTPQSNYPAFPTSVSITQPGSFIKGQDFDASKFSVVVTYLDGSKQTINNAGLTYADTKSDGVSTDDTVTYFAGYDYQNNKVEQTVNISNVYAVDYITATTSKTSFTAGNADPQDFIVTAYFGGTNEVLGANNYTVTVAEATDAKDAEDYAEATSVKGVATVTLDSKLGGKTTTVDVTVSKDVSVVTTDEVADIAMAAKEKQTVKFEAFNYEELPATEELGGNLLFWVTYKDSEGEAEDAPATEPVKGADIEGMTYRYTVGGVALDPAYTSTDFTASAGTGKDGSGIGLEATWNGEVVGSYNVPIAKTEIRLEKESGFGLVAGDDVADITGDSFRALLYIDNKFAEEIAITDEILQIKPDIDVLNSGDVVYISVSYNGLSSNELNISVSAQAAATIKSVEVVLKEGITGPAAQYYTSLASVKPANGDVTKLVVTKSYGEPEEVSTGFTAEYYLSEGVKLSEAKETADKDYDALVGVDSILIGVTYNGEVYYSEPIALSEPVVETVTATANEDGESMVGDTVEVVVKLSNDSGAIDKDYQDYVVLDANGAPAEINTTVGATDVTYAIYTADYAHEGSLTVYAGKGYIAPKGDTVLLKRKTTEMSEKVGGTINIALVKKYFAIDTDSYDPVDGEGDEADPAITGINLPAKQTLVTGDNVIPVEITYVGSDGKEKVDTVNVTIVGTAFVTDDPSFTLMYEGAPIAELVDGRMYYIDKFSVNSDSYTAKGTPTLTIDGTVKNQYGATYTSTFTADSDFDYTFTIGYVDANLEAQTKTVELNTVVPEA